MDVIRHQGSLKTAACWSNQKRKMTVAAISGYPDIAATVVMLCMRARTLLIRGKATRRR